MEAEPEKLAETLRSRARLLRQVVREQLRPYEMELITVIAGVADDLDLCAERIEQRASPG